MALATVALPFMAVAQGVPIADGKSIVQHSLEIAQMSYLTGARELEADKKQRLAELHQEQLEALDATLAMMTGAAPFIGDLETLPGAEPQLAAQFVAADRSESNRHIHKASGGAAAAAGELGTIRESEDKAYIEALKPRQVVAIARMNRFSQRCTNWCHRRQERPLAAVRPTARQRGGSLRARALRLFLTILSAGVDSLFDEPICPRSSRRRNLPPCFVARGFPMPSNPTWVLTSFPTGMPSPDDFSLEDRAVPVAGPGELLVRTLWLSVDPYMRARLSPAKNYAAGQKIGEMMVGGGVGEVITSESPLFQPGDIVQADDFGWQPLTVVAAKTANRLDPAVAPVQTSLGCLGMPGLSAYFSLLHVGRPKAGETVLISAASGALGQVAGQIARIKGFDAVAIAGSDAKLGWCKSIGYRTGINHRSAGDLTAAIAAACPNGVDVFLDNTAGPIHEAALLNLNTFGRIVVVGTVALADRFDQRDIGPRFLRRILVTRARIEGFLLDDFEAKYAEARQDLTGWYQQGLLEAREDVAEGIEAAPHAFIRMLKGENFGKQLVKL